MRMAVNDKLIDIIKPHTSERLINRLHDVFPRQANLVGALTHRHGNLGRNNILITRQ